MSMNNLYRVYEKDCMRTVDERKLARFEKALKETIGKYEAGLIKPSEMVDTYKELR